MFMVWVSVGFILIATGLAILLTVSIRKRRLLSTMRIEIENQGNVESRYQLLAQDELSGLSFHFYQNGEALHGIVKSDGKSVALPPPEPPAAPSRSKGEGVENAIGFTGALANVMIGAGSLMGNFGKPLVTAGNKLFQGQVNAAKAQTVSKQAAALSTGTDRSQYNYQTQQQAAAAPLSGVFWAETAPVKPGEKLIVDLKVQAAYFNRDMAREIVLKSHPAEGSNPPEATANGIVQIRGGFLSHKLYPSLTIIGTSTLLLVLIYWLARIGVLH